MAILVRKWYRCWESGLEKGPTWELCRKVSRRKCARGGRDDAGEKVHLFERTAR